MFRRIWSIPMTALVCLMLLAACGQSNSASPATATSAAAAPTSTTAAAGQSAATSSPRRATATTAAQAPAATSARKGDPKSIVVGKPVSIVAKSSRTVVAVEVKNTGDSYATFTLRPKARSSAKPVLATQTRVMAMPAGATWTVTMIADEIQMRDQDLFDIYVDSFFVVPQPIDPMVRQKIKLAEPVVTVDGKQTKVTVEAKNENDKRVSFKLYVLFVKDGVVTATAQLDATLEPGQSRQLAPFVEGAPDGAVPHTQIINIGGL